MRNLVLRHRFAALALLPLVAACATTPSQTATAPAAPVVTAPPPQQQVVRPAQSTNTFRAPRVMNVPGFEWLVGKNDTAVGNFFGMPALEVKEGDGRKLQFRGPSCVLDVYLYPLRPGADPSVTYVEARRASDGLDVDRLACATALRQ